MSTRAADTLAALLARLTPAGLQWPGKPPKRSRTEVALRLRRAHGHPAAVQQTRSMRLDVETDSDLMAAIAVLGDTPAYRLAMWASMPEWSQAPRLLAELTAELHQARKSWWGKYPESRHGDIRERVVCAVLMELRKADACPDCNATGKGYNAKQEAFTDCKACDGSGRVRMTVQDRSRALDVPWRTYDGTALRPAYTWLYAHCGKVLTHALAQIQHARHCEGGTDCEVCNSIRLEKA